MLSQSEDGVVRRDRLGRGDIAPCSMRGHRRYTRPSLSSPEHSKQQHDRTMDQVAREGVLGLCGADVESTTVSQSTSVATPRAWTVPGHPGSPKPI